MIYLTLENLLAKIQAEHLEEITLGQVIKIGTEGNQAQYADGVGSTILDEAELSSIGEMTGYLDIRYDSSKCFEVSMIPPSPPDHDGYNGISTAISMLTDITLYSAHAGTMPDNIPTLREKRHNLAITWCEKVSQGYIAPLLPVKNTDPTTPLRFGNSSEKNNPYF